MLIGIVCSKQTSLMLLSPKAYAIHLRHMLLFCGILNKYEQIGETWYMLISLTKYQIILLCGWFDSVAYNISIEEQCKYMKY